MFPTGQVNANNLVICLSDIDHFQILKSICPANYFEGTGLRKMALRKLAYEALKEKHHIPKSVHVIRSKVALMPGFI